MPTNTLIKKPIISADSHITEPADIFKGRLSKKYQDIAPYMKRRDEGGDVFIIDGMDHPYPVTLASAAGKRGKALQQQVFANFMDCHHGGWDPKKRLQDQDKDGVGAEVLYPSLGMYLASHNDPQYASAMFEAYEEWLAEYCSVAPDRLIGLGQTAMVTVEQGIKDLERSKKNGMKGVLLPGFPVLEDYDSKIYDDYWAACVDLEMPPSFHILTYRGNTGRDQGRGRMDHAADRNREVDYFLPKMPSEYLFENIYLTFQDDLVAFKVKDMLNTKRLMWASDFPHLDSTFPGSQALLAEHTANLTDEEKTDILHDNCADLYKLNV